MEVQMAHMLEMVDGQAQMAYVGKTPWHGLGVELEEGVTPREMMVAAGLDWSVEKVNMYYGMQDEIKVEGKQALIRSTDSKLLDIVGVDWNPVQNIEAFKFFDSFCKSGQMTMHTAGSLFDGKRVWALAKIASDFELFNGDKVEGFLLFSNPHKFGQAVDIRFTPVRVVCNNTLTLSLGQAVQNAVKLNHRKEFEPEGVKQVLGLASKHMDEYKETALFLGSKKVSDEQFKLFLNEVFGESKKDDKLTRSAQMAYDVIDTQPGAEFARGSWWSALNAVTYVTDHQLGRPGDTRLNSIWYGANRTKKIEAVKKAVQYAEAA
jgi:phage/plasmid-like protein (TIGR03299 family)